MIARLSLPHVALGREKRTEDPAAEDQARRDRRVGWHQCPSLGYDISPEACQSRHRAHAAEPERHLCAGRCGHGRGVDMAPPLTVPRCACGCGRPVSVAGLMTKQCLGRQRREANAAARAAAAGAV